MAQGLLGMLFGGGGAQLPASAAQGSIMRGPDGKNYQYAQTSGMAGAGGPNGWIETSMGPQKGLFGMNPEALVALGSGMMQGNMAGGMAAAGDQMAAHREKMAALQEQQRKTTLTQQWLMQNKGLSAEQAEMAVANQDILGSYLTGGDPTDDMREYEFAKGQGFGGSFVDFQLAQKRAGATSITNTVGGGKYGTIPQGYELIDGPQGASMRPIPGGPEDTSKKDAKSAGQADVATRVITSAASRARDAAKNRNFGATGQSVAAQMPWTDSAEVARQTEVLKSQAKVENLNAMRAASPTGGALGSVTEQETNMLAAKSGALDPNSPNFERDLADYELTLLQVVHGPQEGTRIFEETRNGGGQTIPAPAGGRLRFNPATGDFE